jgi:hypothetical protein
MFFDFGFDKKKREEKRISLYRIDAWVRSSLFRRKKKEKQAESRTSTI